MSLLERYKDNIGQQNLFQTKDKLLLAVSGGVDSVVLCELCKQAGYAFAIAHCNFQLRGEESLRDEQFVKELGKKFEVEVFIKEFDTEKFAKEKKLSIQEAARELRYTWFNELITQSTQQKFQYLLTAHHRDDNAETVAMHFFRGTGLHGLTGIPIKSGYIRRPLLDFFKTEILVFAKENKLAFVEDSSNQLSKYTRNFFRNEILPAISKVYPQVNENLQDNINRFKSIEKLYQFSVGEIKKKLCRVKGKEVHIPVKQLMSYDNKALIYEIIAEYGFNEKQVDELVKLAESESGKYIASPALSFRIIKHRHWFIISPVITTESSNIIIEEKDKSVLFASGSLCIEAIKNIESPIKNNTGKVLTEKNIACLDSRHITFPLLLRKWKTGDYFYPLGMRKKKKLSRFFIDQKLTKTEKENCWVIETGQRIAWITGQRIDDRFKITDHTTAMLKITLK